MRRARGFTLVELIVVMVIVGILAGSIAIYFAPAIQNYVSVSHRANLTDMVDGAVRTMSRDIRSAVANSVRTPGTACFELVPTSTGGRYRTAPDTINDAATPTQWVNTLAPVNGFDVVTPLTTVPVAGDFVVINNQNADDVYNGASRATLKTVEILPANIGDFRFGLTAAMTIATGYDNARFVIVPAAQQAVFYVCDGATGVDANGDGLGKLYRFSSYGFNANTNACPVPAANTPVLATKVQSCTFIYNPNSGGTMSTGYMQLQLQLTERNESVRILVGTHADNTP